MCGYINIVSLLLMTSCLFIDTTSSSYPRPRGFSRSIEFEQDVDTESSAFAGPNEPDDVSDNDDIFIRERRGEQVTDQMKAQSSFSAEKTQKSGPGFQVQKGPMRRLDDYTMLSPATPNFNTSTGIYTAPFSREFGFLVTIGTVTGNGYFSLSICTSNGARRPLFTNAPEPVPKKNFFNKFHLMKGDSMWLEAQVTGDSGASPVSMTVSSIKIQCQAQFWPVS